jgi:hypothetical protein
MMWSKSTLVVVALILDQYDPHVVIQFCVP